MKISFLTAVIFTAVIFSSCEKNKSDENTFSNVMKVDPNNYFTATFAGKTIKTSGAIFTINGSLSFTESNAAINAFLQTENDNSGGGVTSTLWISVSGSVMNLAWGDLYKFPVQDCNATIYLTRSGNATGNYQILEGLSSTITDLTVGNKVYDLDPVTTIFTVSSADATFVQGTYTANLIDGSNKIPVSGRFKVRKLL